MGVPLVVIHFRFECVDYKPSISCHDSRQPQTWFGSVGQQLFFCLWDLRQKVVNESQWGLHISHVCIPKMMSPEATWKWGSEHKYTQFISWQTKRKTIEGKPSANPCRLRFSLSWEYKHLPFSAPKVEGIVSTSMRQTVNRSPCISFAIITQNWFVTRLNIWMNPTILH